MKIYERLSKFYDLQWGGFANNYIDIIKELLSKHQITPAKILDLACGTGNLAIGLAKLGHQVIGLDISPQMVEIAKSKSTHLSNIHFEVCDMAKFKLKDKFDLITCTFDSINYLMEKNDLKKMLSQVSNALRKSGFFIFDSNTENLYLTRHKGTHKHQLGGKSFIQRCIYHKTKKEARTIFKFSDGKTETHFQRPYDLKELEPFLTEVNLNVIQTYSKFDKTPYDSKSERLICIAKKQTKGNVNL